MSADQMSSVKSSNGTGVCFSVDFTYPLGSLILYCTAHLLYS